MSIQLVRHPLWPLVHRAAAMLDEKDVACAPGRKVPVLGADGETS